MTDVTGADRLKRWQGIFNLKFLFFVVAATVALIVGVAVLVWASSAVEPERSVAQQWNDAIKRLGIEPVYPPVEDIVVGDLLAMITDDAASELTSEPLGGTSIKLLHLDLTDEIEKAYRQIYQFPETAERPQKDSQASTQGADSLFKPPDVRRALPLVVFPGFSIVTRKGATASGGISNWWSAVFGAAASSNELLDVKISDAETYGIAAIPAELRLLEFCEAASTKGFCSEDFLRQQLSIVVGSKIYDKVRDVKNESKERWRLSIELGLVTRAFLARSIETSVHSDNAITGDVRAKRDATARTSEQVSGGGTTDPKAGTAVEPLQRQLQAQHDLVAANEVPNGAAASFQRGKSSDVIIPAVVLRRPVVVGFRSVRWKPQRSP
jgi:hypothetical protein